MTCTSTVRRLVLAPLERVFFLAFALVATLGVAFASGVSVVAPGGASVGADFTTIQQAIDAAPPGEIVLVRTGNYGGFIVDGKGVAVVADDVTLVRVLGGIIVRNVPAGEEVVLRSLQVSFILDGGLVANANAGSLRVIDCSFAPDPMFGSQVNQSARFIDCADVVLARCTFRPGSSSQLGGTLGLDVRGGKITLTSCDVEGGRGRDGIPFAQSGQPNTAGEPGKAALRLQSVEAFVSGTRLVGGAGGAGLAGTCGSATVPPTAGGDGGPAVLALNGVALRTLDASITGGIGGAGGVGSGGSCGTQHPGSAGAQVDPPSQAVTQIAGSARSIVVSGPRRENTVVQIDVTGEAGDHVYLVTSRNRAQGFDPFWNGTLLLDAPLRRAFVGTLAVPGTSSTMFFVSELGAGVEGVVRPFQAAIVDALGAVRFTGTDELVLLDQAF